MLFFKGALTKNTKVIKNSLITFGVDCQPCPTDNETDEMLPVGGFNANTFYFNVSGLQAEPAHWQLGLKHCQLFYVVEACWELVRVRTLMLHRLFRFV